MVMTFGMCSIESRRKTMVVEVEQRNDLGFQA